MTFRNNIGLAEMKTQAVRELNEFSEVEIPRADIYYIVRSSITIDSFIHSIFLQAILNKVNSCE